MPKLKKKSTSQKLKERREYKQNKRKNPEWRAIEQRASTDCRRIALQNPVYRKMFNARNTETRRAARKKRKENESRAALKKVGGAESRSIRDQQYRGVQNTRKAQSRQHQLYVAGEEVSTSQVDTDSWIQVNIKQEENYEYTSTFLHPTVEEYGLQEQIDEYDPLDALYNGNQIETTCINGIQLVENPVNDDDIIAPQENTTNVLIKVEINEEENNENTSLFLDHIKEEPGFEEQIDIRDPLDGTNNDDYTATVFIKNKNFSSGDVKVDPDSLFIQSEANEESQVELSRCASDIVISGADNTYKCLYCEKTFPRKDALKRHLRIHLDQGDHRCDICGKCYATLTGLSRHKKLHTGEKPYKCDICDKCFPLKGRLIDHKRIHSTEKPFKCDECDKRFNRQDYVRLHKRVHSGEKPFKCDVCNKCFQQSSNLKRHRKSHTQSNSCTIIKSELTS